MKWYQKITALMLAVLMMFMFAACGEKQMDEPEKAPDEVVVEVKEDTVEEDGASNEAANVYADELLGSQSALYWELFGRNFGAVSRGDSFGSHYNENSQYAEMDYEDNEKNNIIVARMMLAAEGVEPIDIFKDTDHSEFHWETAVEEVIYGDVTAKVLRGFAEGYDFIGAYWLEPDHNMIYGIVVAGETLVLEEYVGEIYYPES